jgi:hypothetical protein
MTAIGPSRHIAAPRDLGREQGIAEVEGQSANVERDAPDPKRSFAWRCRRCLGWMGPWIARGERTG